MATTIRIKRSTGSEAPSSIVNAELAYAEGSDKLWIGTGTGTELQATPVGGKGHFLYLESTASQTAAGAYTFTGSVTATAANMTVATKETTDNSNAAASTAYVKGVIEGLALTDLPDVTANRLLGRKNASGNGPPEALTAEEVTSFLSLSYNDISDFAAGVKLIPLNQLADPVADIDLEETSSGTKHKIINLGDPVNGYDAANKRYVDGVSAGLDFKQSARAVAKTNVASLSGTATTIDGVSLNAEDRVLLIAQTAAEENGLWVVKAGAWQRPEDYATGTGTVSGGAFVFVEEGTDYQNTAYVCTTNGSVDVDTDPTTWSPYSTNPTDVQISSGGTGLSTLAHGALLFGPSSGDIMSTLLINANAGAVLVSDGSVPTWATSIDGGSF